MRHRLQVVVVSIVALALSPAALLGSELPIITVDLATGKKLRAKLDPKTSPDRLWLRFGSSETVVQRGFAWQSVIGVREGERAITQQELIHTADAARQPFADDAPQRIIIRSNGSPSDLPSGATRPEQRSTMRVAAVRFDATLGNWDADVATDGLYIQVTAVDIHGEPVAVRGVLTVELFSMQRVDQDGFAHGRGRNIGLVGRWSTQVACEPGDPSSGLVRLPFQSTHPEFDVDWAPFGLVHIQFVAPGHGVFQHSIDGLRIRPWAPLRDALELQSSKRFFPSELN